MPSFTNALIVGAGSGLSASLARLFARNGIAVSLAARNTGKLEGLASETAGTAYLCDVGDAAAVSGLFAALDGDERTPDLVVYNPSARERGPLTDLDPARVENAIRISAYGGFLVAQEAVKRMLPKHHGAVLFTGASASVKGYAQSAPFAMGKFALRGLAQSMARELHPKGIHIGHFVIDGGIRNPERPERIDPDNNPDSMLDPDAIAEAYWNLLNQHRSAWTSEVELRPWVERF
ncbi:MAG: SDR family NAD(P)-dependent oxidoreductase [Hyphomicrobiales bacterium]|nr:SDR family NAD(P)-dependent oxidoreductase [Hyphomicrobiales bacterium]